MAKEPTDPLRYWHRLFGLLLTDYFTGSPFRVEIEADLSLQRQFLDVLILRRFAGAFADRLPDGMEDLAPHNLVTFKSHREWLYDWVMKELIGHYVAYRKLVSRTPTELLPEDQFRLYAVTARFPSVLSRQVPWHERGPGVYDCQWGTDTIRVIVAGQLPLEPHNAPLHLFSAKPELVSFGSEAFRQKSAKTSSLIRQLFQRFRKESPLMPYTMADFSSDYVKEHFGEMSPQARRELLRSLSVEEQQEALQSLLADRLAGLSEADTKSYLDQLAAAKPEKAAKRRKK